MLDDLVLFKLETEINRIYAQVETDMVSAFTTPAHGRIH